MYRNVIAQAEMECFKRESERRPQAATTATTPDQSRSQTRKKNQARHGYRTRATRGEEQEDDDDFEVIIDGQTWKIVKSRFDDT